MFMHHVLAGCPQRPKGVRSLGLEFLIVVSYHANPGN